MTTPQPILPTSVAMLPDGVPHDATVTFNPRTLAPEAGDALPPDLVTWGTSAPATEGDHEGPAVGRSTAGPAYQLHRVLGRGGMGEVWEATQNSLDRVVAVKRARAARIGDRPGRLQDFRQEAVIAGRLEHPNIVPVHDLGVDEDGSPLLAMKLVRGRPWDRLLAEDFDALPAEEFLAKHLPVLIAVGQAVAFAHAQGIVHRDIKPGQVMTGEFGEALLMDWGLAIQVSQPAETPRPVRVPVATPETASNPAGTIALMAMEQTTGDARQIGTWTDVYLLGGTLYFLLTGTYPHHAPAVAIAFAKAASGEIEHPRQRAPKRTMPEELVELCLHALRRDPAQRIASAKAFVEGLQDYLGGATRRRESRALAEAAAAQLDGARTYADFARIGDSLDRAEALWPENPAVAPALARVHAAHAEAALANGDLVLARSIAERLRDAARRDALIAEADRREALARAQARQRRVLIAASFAMLLVIVAGGAVFTMKLGEQRDLARANAEEAMRNAEAARAARALAETNAEEALRSAEDARASRAEADGLVQFMMTDLSEKLAPIDEDLAALDEAAQRAASYYSGKLEKAARLDDREKWDTVTSLLTVANTLARQGKSEQALDTTRRAAEFAATLTSPGATALYAGAVVSLGQEYRRAGRQADARAEFDRAIQIAAPEKEGAAALPYARALLARADLHQVQGRSADGGRDAEEGVSVLRRLIAANPTDAGLASHLSWGVNKLVTSLANGGKVDEARAELAATREVLERIRELDGDDLLMRTELSQLWGREGQLLQNTGDLEGALDATTRALAHDEEVVRARPTSVDARSNLSFSITRQGSILTDMGRYDEALAPIRRGLDLRLALVAEDPDNKELFVRLRGSWQRLAELHEATGRWADAEPARREALATARRLLANDPSMLNQTLVATDLGDVADVLLRLGRAAEALPLLDESAAILDGPAAASPRVGEGRILHLSLRARALHATGSADATAAAEAALAAYAQYPRFADTARMLVLKCHVLRILGREEEARELADALWEQGMKTKAVEELRK